MNSVRARPPRGVALLEVIVALVLLAGSGAALFAWINQNLRSAARLAETDARARLMLNALELVDQLNPAEQPEGEREVARLHVSWRASVVQPLRSNVVPGGAPGVWLIGLYQVQVQARVAGAGPSVEFAVVKTGWQRQSGPVVSR